MVISINNTDLQKKVSARERIQNFMLAQSNLINNNSPKKSKLCGLIFVVGGKTFFLPLKGCFM